MCQPSEKQVWSYLQGCTDSDTRTTENIKRVELSTVLVRQFPDFKMKTILQIKHL